MCVNCNDNINAVVVYSGPAGPQGVAGLNATMSATSNTSYLIASSGSQTFTLTPNVLNLGWAIGTRLRVSNSPVNFMEGVVTAVSSSSVTISAQTSSQSGTYASWTISIAGGLGPQGIQGIQGIQGVQGVQGNIGVTGINAYTKTSVIAFGPVNEYIITVSTSTLWMAIGQVLYIENCGYFQVLSFSPTAIVQVLDLLYPGNNPGNLTSNLSISPGGISGTLSTTGTYTPALTDSLNVVVPNIICNGFYTETGGVVHLEIFVSFLNVTSFGTGAYSLTFPSGFNAVRNNQYFVGSIEDGSTGDFYQLKTKVLASTAKFQLYTIRQATLLDIPVTPIVPFTISSTTRFFLSFTYQKV